MAGGTCAPLETELELNHPTIVSPSTSDDQKSVELELDTTFPRFIIYNVSTLDGYPFQQVTKADLYRKRQQFRRHNPEPFMSFHSCNTSILGAMKHPILSLDHRKSFSGPSSVFSYSAALKEQPLKLSIEDYPSSTSPPSESCPSSDTASWSTRDLEVESITSGSDTDTDSVGTYTLPMEYSTEITKNEIEFELPSTKCILDSASSSEDGSENHCSYRRSRSTRAIKSTKIVAQLDAEGEIFFGDFTHQQIVVVVEKICGREIGQAQKSQKQELE